VADDTDPPEGDLDDRVTRLETGQTQIIGRLDQLLAGGHRKAEEHEENKLGRPTSIEEQVRAELERKDREASEAADKEGTKTALATVKDTLAKLTEVKPVQPQPRRQRVMWGPQ
jgi:hypothetical protein